jgi:hypothetical protein
LLPECWQKSGHKNFKQTIGKYLGMTVTHKNLIQKAIMGRLNSAISSAFKEIKNYNI